MTVSKHKLTSLQVSSFIENQNKNAVMIVIVGLIASAVGNTKLTIQQSLSLLYTLGKNLGTKANVEVSIVAVGEHKHTCLQVSFFIANQSGKTVLRVIVGLIDSAVGNTKFMNKQRLSLLYTLNKTVGIKAKVGIS